MMQIHTLFYQPAAGVPFGARGYSIITNNNANHNGLSLQKVASDQLCIIMMSHKTSLTPAQLVSISNCRLML